MSTPESPNHNLTMSDKEFISSQTRLYVSKLNAQIVQKLLHTNQVEMKKSQVSQVLDIANFEKYPHLVKAISWRNNLIDQQKRSQFDKQFYKQITLAKVILSVALRNMGESKLASEIWLSAANASNFKTASSSGTLKSQIFSGSYIKCLHAFQHIASANNGIWSVDALLWPTTLQKLMSYANYQTTNPVIIINQNTRDHTENELDYTSSAVVRNEISWLHKQYPLVTLTLDQWQKILQKLNIISTHTKPAYVVNLIDPYKEQVIDHMLQLWASSPHLTYVQNLNNLKASVTHSTDISKFDKMGQQYRQDYLNTKASASSHNPYIKSAFNPRNYIKSERTKWWDELFHDGLNITPQMEKYLYNTRFWDLDYTKWIAYVVAKDWVLNLPDDIAMFVWDVMALWAAAISWQWLLTQYLWARWNADTNPKAAQDLAWMVEAHPILWLLNILSRDTIKSLWSQLWTVMTWEWTAKQVGDFVNMIGWLVMWGWAVIKVGGRVIEFSSKLARSEKAARIGSKITKLWSKITKLWSQIDPADIAIWWASAVVWSAVDAVRWTKKPAKTLVSVDSSESPSKAVDPSDIKLPETLRILTRESDIIDAQKSLNREIARGMLSAEEIWRKLGIFIMEFHAALKRGVDISTQTITKTYLWIKQKFDNLSPSNKRKHQSKIDDMNDQLSTKLEEVVQKTLWDSPIMKDWLQDLTKSSNAIDAVVRLGKLTDSRWWFEWLMAQAPIWVIKQIPWLNLLPVEAATNLIYAVIQYKYARKIGMGADQIKIMMNNQIKDSGISLASSVVRWAVGGWLGFLNPLNWILSAWFGLGDFAFRANIKNAQEFVHFYGQQIETLKAIDNTNPQLAIHQQKFDKLNRDLDIKVKKYETNINIWNNIKSAKNINELKSIIIKKLPINIQIWEKWVIWSYSLTRKELLGRVDDYLSGRDKNGVFLPKAYGIQETVLKIKPLVSNSSAVSI